MHFLQKIICFFLKILKVYLKNHFLHNEERKWYELAGNLLKDRHEASIEEVIEAGNNYLPLNFDGEAILTVGITEIFKDQAIKYL